MQSGIDFLLIANALALPNDPKYKQNFYLSRTKSKVGTNVGSRSSEIKYMRCRFEVKDTGIDQKSRCPAKRSSLGEDRGDLMNYEKSYIA